MTSSQKSFEGPVLAHIRSNFLLWRRDWTVHETIKHLREAQLGADIFYFYVIDETERLTGIIPTCKLLTSISDLATLFCFGIATVFIT
jgi:Mg/Co/Ni transporter MgtE